MATYTVEFITADSADIHTVHEQPAGSASDAASRIHYAYGAAISAADSAGRTSDARYRVALTGSQTWHHFTVIGTPDRHAVLSGWDGNE